MKRAVLLVLLLFAARVRADHECAPMRPWEVSVGYLGTLSACTPSGAPCYPGETILFFPAGNPFDCQPTTWEWQFGDGSSALSHRTGGHTFDAPGIYNVTLKVTQPHQTFTLAQAVRIELCACPCPLMSDNNVFLTFAGSQTGCAPLTATACRANELLTFRVVTLDYTFSCSPHQVTWQFGDGSTASGLEVTHAYSGRGTYDVSVTIVNPMQTKTLMNRVDVLAANHRRRSARH